MEAESQGDMFTHVLLIYSFNKWFLRPNLCLTLCPPEESLVEEIDPADTHSHLSQ